MFNNPTFNNRWMVRPDGKPAPIPANNKAHATLLGMGKRPFRLIPVVVFTSKEITNEQS